MALAYTALTLFTHTGIFHQIMKALLIIFSLLLVLLIAGLWIGPGSYPDRWRLDDRTTIQEQENKTRTAEINKIQAELEDVSSSKEALEERARSELGMTKKGETFFEVIMQPDTKKRKQNVAEKSLVEGNTAEKNTAEDLDTTITNETETVKQTN